LVYRGLLRICRAAYSNENHEVATALYNICSVYHRQGHYERDLFGRIRESLCTERAAYNHEHPEVAVTLYSMGQRVNHDQGQYETRFGRKYREPLRIYSGPRYGNDHVNGRKRLWHGQTTCTKRQGQYETRLLDEYREVVAHNESGPRNGNEHPNGATLGKLHLSKKDWTHYDDATRIGPLKA
jgi:hypothetical protein